MHFTAIGQMCAFLWVYIHVFVVALLPASISPESSIQLLRFMCCLLYPPPSPSHCSSGAKSNKQSCRACNQRTPKLWGISLALLHKYPESDNTDKQTTQTSLPRQGLCLWKRLPCPVCCGGNLSRDLTMVVMHDHKHTNCNNMCCIRASYTTSPACVFCRPPDFLAVYKFTFLIILTCRPLPSIFRKLSLSTPLPFHHGCSFLLIIQSLLALFGILNLNLRAALQPALYL